MNFGMIDVLVSSHTGDIRRRVASRRAAARDVRAGFLLPGDALEIGAAAAASQIGPPPPTG